MLEDDLIMVRALARKLARGDKTERDDLEQEAMLALIELDPQKIRQNSAAARYYCAQTAIQNWLRRARRRARIEGVFAQGGLPPRQVRKGVNNKKRRCSGVARSLTSAARQLPVRRNAPRHLDAAPLDME